MCGVSQAAAGLLCLFLGSCSTNVSNRNRTLDAYRVLSSARVKAQPVEVGNGPQKRSLMVFWWMGKTFVYEPELGTRKSFDRIEPDLKKVVAREVPGSMQKITPFLHSEASSFDDLFYNPDQLKKGCAIAAIARYQSLQARRIPSRVLAISYDGFSIGHSVTVLWLNGATYAYDDLLGTYKISPVAVYSPERLVTLLAPGLAAPPGSALSMVYPKLPRSGMFLDSSRSFQAAR